MSDELKQDTEGAAHSGETAGNQHFNLVVKCYRDVYRRAGFPFTRGENHLVDVTEEQVRILARDNVLKIVSGSPASDAKEPGAVDDVGVDGVGQFNSLSLDARILAAVADLDKENSEHYTTTGTPKVAAVSAMLGENITSEQLKAALATQGEDA